MSVNSAPHRAYTNAFDCLRSEKEAKDFAKDEFLDENRDGDGEDESGDDCQRGDCELHKGLQIRRYKWHAEAQL